MGKYRNFTRGSSPPLVGALLRQPLQAVRRRILTDLALNAFDDIHPAHLNVFQHPPPRGARPGELARASGMTKQAMNHLLGQLTGLGYLERRPFAGGGAGMAVWLTARGEEAVRVMRKAVTAVEAEWAEGLGKRRFAALRQLLVELNERL